MNDTNKPVEEEISIKDFFLQLLQHWMIILAAAILAVMVGLFYLKTTLPIYSTNAILQVEDQSASSALLLDDLAGFDSTSEVSTEIELLKSRMILGQVAEHLNLNISLAPVIEGRLNKILQKKEVLLVSHTKKGVSYTKGKKKVLIKSLDVSDELLDKTFNLKFIDDKSYELSLLSGTKKVIKIIGNPNKKLEKMTSKGAISLDINYENMKGQNFTLSKKGLLKSTGSISKTLSASEKGRGTGILSLKMQGVDKEKITNTLNEIINTYVARNLDSKSAEKQKTLEFFKNQLPELKANLETAENKFNKFRDANQTIDVDREAQLLLGESIRLNAVKLQLEQQRAELSARFTGEYPVLKQVDSQLKAVASRYAKVDSRLKSLPTIQQTYLKLYRDVTINTELYTNLLNDYQKLEIAKSGEIGNIQIIDKAIKPLRPIKPNSPVIMVMSLLLGLCAGAGIVLLKMMLNSGVKSSNKIEQLLKIQSLADIPHSKKQKKLFGILNRNKPNKLLYTNSPQDMTIEALRNLRTALFFSKNKVIKGDINDHGVSTKNNVIMIAGASKNIGKSFIAANFAAVLTESGKNVVLVDADLRQGTLHKYYGKENVAGLVEYVNKSSRDEKCTKDTMIDTLKIITKGEDTSNPSCILMSDRFRDLIHDLSENNDYVVIDSPETTNVTDSSIIGEIASSTIFVTRHGVSKQPEIKAAVDKLQASGCNLNGFVLNDVPKELF